MVTVPLAGWPAGATEKVRSAVASSTSVAETEPVTAVSSSVVALAAAATGASLSAATTTVATALEEAPLLSVTV